MHDFTADNFAFDKIHALCTFKCSRFRNGLGCREEHGEHDSAVCKPFHFRTNLLAACNEIFDFFHTDMAVVGFVQFINIDDLFGTFKRAAADECGGIVDKIGIVLLNVVVAVVCGDGSHVVSFALENCSGTDAAVDFSCNAVAVALGVNAAVNEEAFFNGVEIAAEFKHFFHEEDRSFLQLACFFAQIAAVFQLDHFHKAVETDESLLRGVACFDIVNMPRHVAALIGRDRALDIRTGELGDEHVQNVGDGCFTGTGLNIFCVHLSAHTVFMEQIAESNRIRKIHVYAGRGGCRRGNGGQADVLFVNADARRENCIDTVLNHKLGHDFPCFTCGCVCIVCAVNLRHAGPCDKLLAFARINKRTNHIDVAVDDVVLRVLVNAVYAFFRKHNSNIGACNAGNIAVVVDGSSDFILDHVECLALCTNLLARNGNAAHALRCAFDKSVKVALSGRADNHYVICAVVRCHTHSANIILKAAGCDFCRDNRRGLRVDVLEIVCGGQGNARLERFGAVMINKGSHMQVFNGFAPRPAPAAGTVVFKIFEDLGNVNGFIGGKVIVAHQLLPPSKSFSASSQSLPSASASPAGRISEFCAFARR